ncbi:hypothetical protein J2W35_004151 [Variovorax boronicumulans]|uniref:hypothetical protein n=1 Tax=Variovorax boronicumulans TaxID=436515 RepID=UPI0027854D41|nr:hypothetical protein [Variovorax boronicumulans]MDQ0083785.1 hypothetical protein [Variovorax boronicumulans]
MMSQSVVSIYLICFAFGLSGAVMGGWLVSRLARGQIEGTGQAQMQALREVLDAAVPAGRQVPGGNGATPPNFGDEILHEVRKTVSSSLSGHLLESNALLVRLISEARAFGKYGKALQEDMQALRCVYDEFVGRVQLALQEQASRHAEELQSYAAQVQSLLTECAREIRQIVLERSKLSVPALPEMLNDVAAELLTHVIPQFEEQRRRAEQMQQGVEQIFQLVLQRMPQVIQQAIQVELEFQAQSQVQRDEARLLEQRRRDDERNNHLAAELNKMHRVLAACSVRVPSANEAPADAARQSVSAPGPVFPVSGTLPAPPPTMSARPPEKESVPLARSVSEPEKQTLELTEAEIDALPPELPVSVTPGRRILAMPKKSTLRNL